MVLLATEPRRLSQKVLLRCGQPVGASGYSCSTTRGEPRSQATSRIRVWEPATGMLICKSTVSCLIGKPTALMGHEASRSIVSFPDPPPASTKTNVGVGGGSGNETILLLALFPDPPPAPQKTNAGVGGGSGNETILLLASFPDPPPAPQERMRGWVEGLGTRPARV